MIGERILKHYDPLTGRAVWLVEEDGKVFEVHSQADLDADMAYAAAIRDNNNQFGSHRHLAHVPHSISEVYKARHGVDPLKDEDSFKHFCKNPDFAKFVTGGKE